MNKKIFSAFLCLLLIAYVVSPVYAQGATTVTIKSPQELMEFSENCRLDSYSAGIRVYLLRDIDLSDTEFQSIPIFSGSFYGNNHTISGLTITGEGSQQGLFRYLTAESTVQDLTVTGTITPSGGQRDVGAIAGSNSGQILNCAFTGTVSGGENVGGLAGFNTVTGIIADCSVSGEIFGSHFVGGIAGTNYGVIRNCSSIASVNTTPQQNTVGIEDITIGSLTDSEAANTATDIGGIAGLSTGVIRSCENRGDVGYPHMGYNIGGIAGTQAGYIVDCNNYGNIQGRKEVGGIVGQMEPTTYIEFDTDTFQILKGQLEDMSGIVNRAVTNAQVNASGITGNLGVLWDQTQAAGEALDALIPGGNGNIFDLDAYLAAQSTLGSAIGSMPDAIGGVAASAQATVSGLGRDLRELSTHIEAMGQTLNESAETLGGSILDISDQDSPDILTGKIASCSNYGSVLADLNAGGIVGAMAVENDLDILEDWYTVGENSLNFTSQVRAVVVDCENTGSVCAKNQNIGGIVGWQSLGLVSRCINTGLIDGAPAEYVGGISGQSNGFIRNCSAKCRISGSQFVGGIAGSAVNVTDCRSIVTIDSGLEKSGAILGTIGQSLSDNTTISGNYYYFSGKDIGAIDGISYAQIAQPLEWKEFILLPGLPMQFDRVYVTFVFDDGTQKVLPVAPGGKLNEKRIPSVPEKDGHPGYWEGLTEELISCITYDLTFHATYPGSISTLQSEQGNESGIPKLLAHGSFSHGDTVELLPASKDCTTSNGETLLESWEIRIPESNAPVSIHLLMEGQDLERMKVMVLTSNGWESREYITMGRYLVFDLAEGETVISILQRTNFTYPLIIGISVLCIVLIISIAALVRKKRSKKA